MLYDIDDKIQLNICLPRYFRGKLRRIAAEKMVEDPERLESAASVGAEIIKEYLNEQDANKNEKEK